MSLLSQFKSAGISKSFSKDVEAIFNLEEYLIGLGEQLEPLYDEIMKKSAISANALLPNPVKPVAGSDAWNLFIKERAGKIAKDINKETQKQILASLKQGQKLGENANQLRVRVEDVMGSASSNRADLIARTESKRAASQADILTWRESGVVIGKEWFAQSGHPCPYCDSMEGKVTGLEENYFDLGATHTVDVVGKTGNVTTQSRVYDYESVIAPPLHPRCQCILLPVIQKI